jgi:hypothetical protein
MNGDGKDWFFRTRKRTDLTPRQSEILRLKDKLTVLHLKEHPTSLDLNEMVELQSAVKRLERIEQETDGASFRCVACDALLDDEGTYCTACTAAYEDVLGRCDHG